MRLEGLKAVPPLRPRGWRLAGNGGYGEIGLGIRAALTAGVGAVVVDKEAAAAKVLLHAPHRALEHLSDLAGLEMAERVPDELGALFVVGAIESDQVEVRVEPEIGRSSLYHGGV